MLQYLRTSLLLALMTASSGGIAPVRAEAEAEDCGDVQHNVENGMIRLPEFSGENIRDINCSWTYVAPPSRKLLVKVDSVHLPPLDFRSSSFQLYIDDQLHDIPRNCVKCLKEMIGGKTIRVMFSSFAVVLTETTPSYYNESSTNPYEGVGSFQVRYKSFDPHRCNKPEQIPNGHIVSKGRKVGQVIFYRCNPPYDIFGDSESQCVIPSNSPVPDWSNKAPKCAIQDCTNGPIVREGAYGSIASPGFPSYDYQFMSPCLWIVKSPPNQQIKVSISYLRLPSVHNNYDFTENSSRLALIDGDSLYIANLTESLTNEPLNFTTTSNKLTVKFIVDGGDNKRKGGIGFYLDYSVISSSCPKPRAPANGEIIGYSIDVGSVVTYKCQKDFILVGEFHAECLLNGQWSNSAPRCESLTAEVPVFVAASNDSDTVSAKLSEITPLGGEPAGGTMPPKPFRGVKKKVKEFNPVNLITDTISLITTTTEKNPHLSPPSTEPPSSPSTELTRKGGTKNGRKYDKETGPKSEPHLFQLIPPKNSPEKTPVDSARPPKSGNSSKSDDQLPDGSEVPGGGKPTKRHPLMTVTMISIIAGVGAPVAVAIILLIAIVIYRRRYPVRMRFGRKFPTFENPMYVSKDAQHPRELKRLTT